MSCQQLTLCDMMITRRRHEQLVNGHAQDQYLVLFSVSLIGATHDIRKERRVTFLHIKHFVSTRAITLHKKLYAYIACGDISLASSKTQYNVILPNSCHGVRRNKMVP